jgi:hypothetical protein
MVFSGIEVYGLIVAGFLLWNFNMRDCREGAVEEASIDSRNII